MQFTWDQRKDRVNQRKHGISFATAILVFDDPDHVSVQDREVDGEARWQTIGMVSGVRVLVVAHTVDEDEEVIRIISARKATPSERNTYMPKRSRVVTIRRMPPRALTGNQEKELAAVAALPDEQIDTSDIPELSPAAWKDAVRGRFYRPVKQAVSMRLDADVVAWLKKRGKGYQTRANRILRQHMLADMKRA